MLKKNGKSIRFQPTLMEFCIEILFDPIPNAHLIQPILIKVKPGLSSVKFDFDGVKIKVGLLR